jgi:hypothetical protein
MKSDIFCLQTVLSAKDLYNPYFANSARPRPEKSHKSTLSGSGATKLNPFLNVYLAKDKMARHHLVIGAVFSSGS